MKYFYTYKGEDYESDDPLEVADYIFDTAQEDEELKDKVLKAISDAMVNGIEDEDYLDTLYFHETLEKLRQMKIRNFND